METVRCNACGSDEVRPIRRPRDWLYDPAQAFTVVQCRTCGLAYLNPRPTREDMGRHYPKAYQDKIRSVTLSAPRHPLIRRGVTMIRNRRLPKCPPGRVLDVGCASGAFLAAMRERGWAAEGLEVDAEAAAFARERLGLDVRTGAAETALADLDGGRYDLVTLWHVIEHLFDPAGVLRETRRVLKPGGRLMIEVPNLRSVPSAVFGSCWFTLEAPRHLYHFTPRTIAALLARCGFRLDALRGVPAPQAIAWSLQIVRRARARELRPLDLGLNAPALAAVFPLDWCLARCRLSSVMKVVASAADGVGS